MARKQKTIHYLYKTTCIITGRYYIGMHSTHDLDDGYMGSGRRLRASIRKHGEENHVKEILKFFETREMLVEAEKTAITEDMISDTNCMNLKGGGTGGYISEEQQKRRSDVANKVLNQKLQNDPQFREEWITKMKDGLKKAYDTGKKCKNWGKDWTGSKHSEETKQKMSESSKGIGKGKSNSQYGTCWITKEGENKKIKKEELETYQSQGWVKGRKIR